MTGHVLKRLRGSIAYEVWCVLRGLVSSIRPARCCSCRMELDAALVELARARHRSEG